MSPQGSSSGRSPKEPRPSPHGGPLSPGYARYAGIGIQFAATMGVVGGLGYWADHAFGSTPWLMIVGIFLGAAGGFVSLIKKVPASSPRRTPDEPQDPPAAR